MELFGFMIYVSTKKAPVRLMLRGVYRWYENGYIPGRTKAQHVRTSPSFFVFSLGRTGRKKKLKLGRLTALLPYTFCVVYVSILIQLCSFPLLPCNRAVFGKAYVEIRYMLETNLLGRFMETTEFKEEESRTPLPRARRRNRGGSNGDMCFDVENPLGTTSSDTLSRSPPEVSPPESC